MPTPPELLHLVYPGPFPTLLYGRNSVDPSQKGRSVNAQMRVLRKMCDDNNWPIVGVFDKDVNRSASRHAKRERPDFENLLEAIYAGKARIVAAFEASRYYRDIEIYIRIRNACAETGTLFCYNGTVYDLSKRADRNATAQDALRAEDEVEGIRDRNLRTIRQLAEDGLPAGVVLYGYLRRYDPDTGDFVEQVEHPAHGAVVREVFRRAAASEHIKRIADDLLDRGILTQYGQPFSRRRITGMLRNRSYAGIRVHRGEALRTAQWPALVDEETFNHVQAILNAPGRRTSPSNKVAHLQTGITLCGEHGNRDGLGDEPPVHYTKNNKRKSYCCSAEHHISINEPLLDAYVEEAVVRWLSSKNAADAFRDDAEIEEAAAARRRHKALTRQLWEARERAGTFDELGQPMLSLDSLSALEARLRPAIAEADEAAQRVGVPPILRDLAGRPDAEEAWAALDICQKRTVLRQIVTVRVFKARAKGLKVIEPGRVTLSFVGQPGFKGGRSPGRGPLPVPAVRSESALAEAAASGTR
jgi:site-specific DNA recombinase